MNLMTNALLEKYAPIHIITGWDEVDVSNAGDWHQYLERETGVGGHRWGAYPAFLLMDEAQESYWDDGLWAAFFKSIGPGYVCRIVLITSYCLPNSGSPHLFRREFETVPMRFGRPQQISLQLGDAMYWDTLSCRVGLLLQKDESKRLVTDYAAEIISSSVSLTVDLQKCLFRCSRGHIGVLKALVKILLCNDEIQSFVKQGRQLDWQIASRSLFSDPVLFFESLRNKCLPSGLPQSGNWKDTETTELLVTGIDRNCVEPFKYDHGYDISNIKLVLEAIWRDGWLQGEEDIYGTSFVFPTEIHRWYFQFLPVEQVSDKAQLRETSQSAVERLNLHSVGE